RPGLGQRDADERREDHRQPPAHVDALTAHGRPAYTHESELTSARSRSDIRAAHARTTTTPREAPPLGSRRCNGGDVHALAGTLRSLTHLRPAPRRRRRRTHRGRARLLADDRQRARGRAPRLHIPNRTRLHALGAAPAG